MGDREEGIWVGVVGWRKAGREVPEGTWMEVAAQVGWTVGELSALLFSVLGSLPQP